MQNKIVIILLLSLLIGIFASSSAQETKIKNTNIQSRHAVSMNVDYFFKNEYKTSFGMGVNLNYYYEFIPGLGVNLGLGFTLPNQRLSIEFYPAEVWWKFPDIGFGFKSSLGLKIKI
ncbi:MAG: hypothetical protein RSC04_03500 [Bacteroidales bacterium]